MNEFKVGDWITKSVWNKYYEVAKIDGQYITLKTGTDEVSFKYDTRGEFAPFIKREQMKNQRAHKELIIAYANGADIQWRMFAGNAWGSLTVCCFYANYQYRIKPTETIVKYAQIDLLACGLDMRDDQRPHSNVKLTYDPDTLKLLTAEVI